MAAGAGVSGVLTAAEASGAVAGAGLGGAVCGAWGAGGVVGSRLPPESVPGRSVARCVGAGTSELSVSDAAGHSTAAAGAPGGTPMGSVGRSSGRAGTAERS